MANYGVATPPLRGNEAVALDGGARSATTQAIANLAAGGSGITTLTGDVAAGPGSGSQAATLATVNSNVGSFTNASITVNGKGLITAAANGTGGLTGFTTADNTALGVGAGAVDDPAHINVFIGAQAGADNTTGNQNVFIGNGAGGSNVTGYGIVFIGRSAGGSFSGSGYGHTCVGDRAGFSLLSGYGNTFLGSSAGRLTDTGQYNTYVGQQAGRLNFSGSHNIMIGRATEAPTDTTSNYLNIGDVITGDMVAGPITVGPLFATPTHTPSSAADTGTAGTVTWDSGFVYVCVATDTWKRVAIATWP